MAENGSGCLKEVMTSNSAVRIAGIIGFLGVLLGAFGAHRLEKMGFPADQILERLKWWETASRYHLIHAVLLLVIALWTPVRTLAFWLGVSGITIFSGTLYLMSLGAPRWFGAITPIGGLLLMACWLSLVFGKRAEP